MITSSFLFSIRDEARTLFYNTSITLSDVSCWSSENIPEESDEVTEFLPRSKIYVCVKKKIDKRKRA